MKVWNATVANLTLMALGSSAPEILLSRAPVKVSFRRFQLILYKIPTFSGLSSCFSLGIIELLGNQMYSGELGPSTIVGAGPCGMERMV